MPANDNSHIVKMNKERKRMLTESMDTNNRATDEDSMERHIVGVKNYVNGLDEFNKDKLKKYFDEYCENDDNFKEIEVVEKAKRTLSEEQKAKMMAGLKAHHEAAKAAKAAREAAASEKGEKAEDKPKPKAKTAKA